MFQLRIDPKKTALFFLAIVVSLTMIHSIALTIFFSTGNHELVSITDYVDLDVEKNIPSFYSAFAIFLCSLLFFCISSLEKKQGRRRCYWLGLAAVFLFLSLDEAFVLHEGVGDYTEEYLKTTGLFQATGLLYFPWIISYGIFTTLLGVLYSRFILCLPRKTTVLLILSAVIFLTGAVAFDMLGGREAELHGYYSITYTVLYTIEEFLEMIGIILLMYTLLDYIEKQFGHLSFSLQIQEL
ncbi:MAG: hypothetical protein WBM35_03215 [Candidatus Electrothrix sp.]